MFYSRLPTSRIITRRKSLPYIIAGCSPTPLIRINSSISRGFFWAISRNTASEKILNAGTRCLAAKRFRTSNSFPSSFSSESLSITFTRFFLRYSANISCCCRNLLFFSFSYCCISSRRALSAARRREYSSRSFAFCSQHEQLPHSSGAASPKYPNKKFRRQRSVLE